MPAPILRPIQARNAPLVHVDALCGNGIKTRNYRERQRHIG